MSRAITSGRASWTGAVDSAALEDSAGAVVNSDNDAAAGIGLSTVPETDAYAILLAGLGIIAFVSGRRRRAD